MLIFSGKPLQHQLIKSNLLFQGKGPGVGTGSSDGSGAGYGGTGGSGRVTMTTASPYGDYTNPRLFGSGGGLGSAGSGGGVLSLEVAETLVVEGMSQIIWR